MRKRFVAFAGILSVNLVLAAPATAAEVNCNRDCLAGVMNTYLQALVKHDAASLPTTRNVKYTENGVRLSLGDGLWQTASAMPTYRLDVIDEEAGQVGLLGPHQRERQQQLVRRAPEGGAGPQVSEIEMLVNRSISGGGPGARRAARAPRRPPSRIR